jgi:hypothetical protein
MTENENRNEAERAAAEREEREAGLGNDDWGQFLCDECAFCERREVCFGK